VRSTVEYLKLIFFLFFNYACHRHGYVNSTETSFTNTKTKLFVSMFKYILILVYYCFHIKLCLGCYYILSEKIIGPSLQSTFFTTGNFRAEYTIKKVIAYPIYIICPQRLLSSHVTIHYVIVFYILIKN